MFSLASFALAVTAASSVSGFVVPRTNPPAGWATKYLESYDVYHARYLAIGCSSKHNIPFFDQCCHPLLAGQKADTALPALCTSALSASSPSAVAPTPTASDDGEDDLCDDDDDESEGSSSAASATPTPTASDDDEDDSCDVDDDDSEESSSPVAVSTPAVKTTPTSTQAPSSTATPAKTTTSTKTSTTPSQATSLARVEPTPASQSLITGGVATYFYQNGVAGACGTVHRDSDFVAAMDKDRYGNLNVKSSLCGKQVKIINPTNKKSVVVTIADACPTCKNGNSIDLSVGAFKQIATQEQGQVGIEWSFV